MSTEVHTSKLPDGFHLRQTVHYIANGRMVLLGLIAGLAIGARLGMLLPTAPPPAPVVNYCYEPAVITIPPAIGWTDDIILIEGAGGDTQLMTIDSLGRVEFP